MTNTTIPLNWKEQCHALFKTQDYFEVFFAGSGSIDDSPDVDLYLHIDGNSAKPALYIPEDITAAVKWTVITSDGTNREAIEELGVFNRPSGGNAAYTGGEIASLTAAHSIVPTANTTYQCLQVIVSRDASGDAATVRVYARAEVMVLQRGAKGGSASGVSA